MKFRDLVYLIKSDLYRYTGEIDITLFFVKVFLSVGFKYSFWNRICLYLKQNKMFRYSLYYIARFMREHYKYKFGISIPYVTEIGSGFYIGHYGGIVVHEKTVIGKNCNISHGVTLGQANRGRMKGYPVIGDNVFIGPGAKVFGNIKIGDNVAIGANCVVTKDIPANAVVVGVPGKVISMNGSEGYINRTDYDNFIKKDGG